MIALPGEAHRPSASGRGARPRQHGRPPGRSAGQGQPAGRARRRRALPPRRGGLRPAGLRARRRAVRPLPRALGRPEPALQHRAGRAAGRRLHRRGQSLPEIPRRGAGRGEPRRRRGQAGRHGALRGGRFSRLLTACARAGGGRHDRPRAESRAEPRASSAGLWVAGGGAALLGVSAFFWYRAWDADRELDDLFADGGVYDAHYQGLADRIDTSRTVAIATGAVGVAALAGGLIYHLALRPRRAGAEEPRAGLVPTAGGAMLVVGCGL